MTPDDPALSGEPETTADMFLGGRLTIEQPARGFRAGLDAVLLAAAVRLRKEASIKVLVAGSGVGTAGLCVACRLPQAHVVLVERAPTLAALARGNTTRNRLDDRVRVLEADILGPAAAQEAAGLVPATFDTVIANPPYLEVGRHRLPADDVAAGAFGQEKGDLEGWMRFIARMTAADGRMIMIHRADALGEILAAFDGRFGGIVVRPLHPRKGEAAVRVLAGGIKGSRAPLRLMPGVVLHEPDGHGFTPQLQAILRDGDGLDLFATG